MTDRQVHPHPVRPRAGPGMLFKHTAHAGGMSSWWTGGVADVGWLTMTDVVQQCRTIVTSRSSATQTPVTAAR
jgi:2-methylisocitrate lyase-like PEP mutase family enzyme